MTASINMYVLIWLLVQLVIIAMVISTASNHCYGFQTDLISVTLVYLFFSAHKVDCWVIIRCLMCKVVSPCFVFNRPFPQEKRGSVMLERNQRTKRRIDSRRHFHVNTNVSLMWCYTIYSIE